MTRQAFNRAGAKPEGPSGIDIHEAILRERPDLQGKPALFLDNGAKGHVIIIGDGDGNGGEVFKAPKNVNPEGEPLKDFNTEVEYLTALKGKGLPVPEITTIGRDHFFFGMTRIPGERLPHSLPDDQQQAVVKELIDFVVKMAHALPLRDGKFANHDDLWHSNIMVDAQTKRLNGVIDFGKVEYITADQWKPMYDFDGSPMHALLQEEFDRRRSDLPTSARPALDTATEPPKPEAPVRNKKPRFSRLRALLHA